MRANGIDGISVLDLEEESVYLLIQKERLQNMNNMKYTYDLATQEEYIRFYEHLSQSMKSVGFVPRDSMDDFITRFKRLLGRSLAEKRDIRLLHKLLQIFEERIQNLENLRGEKETKKRKIH